MRALPALASIALLAVVVSCGADRDDENSPGGNGAALSPSASQSEGESRDPELAEKTLAKAVAAISSEEVTWFRATTAINFRPVQVTEGLAKAGVWKTTTTFSEPGGPDNVMLALSARDTVWMQMKGWPRDQAKCWLEMSPTQVPLGIMALRPGEPGYLSALGYLRATGFASDPSGRTLRTTLDLETALSLLNGPLVKQIELTPQQAAAGDVEVMVGVKDQRVANLRMRGPSVLTALDKTGATVGDDARSALPSVDVNVEYPVRTGNTDVSPPPARLIAQLGDNGCAD